MGLGYLAILGGFGLASYAGYRYVQGLKTSLSAGNIIRQVVQSTTGSSGSNGGTFSSPGGDNTARDVQIGVNTSLDVLTKLPGIIKGFQGLGGGGGDSSEE